MAENYIYNNFCPKPTCTLPCQTALICENYFLTLYQNIMLYSPMWLKKVLFLLANGKF